MTRAKGKSIRKQQVVELTDAEFEALSLDDQSTYLTNQTRHDAAVKANYTRTLLKLDDDRLAAIVKLILFPSPNEELREEFGEDYKDGDENLGDAVEAVEILTQGQTSINSSSDVWNYVWRIQNEFNTAIAELGTSQTAEEAEKTAVTRG